MYKMPKEIALELAAIKSQLKDREGYDYPERPPEGVMMETEDGWIILCRGELKVVKWGRYVECGTYESPDGGSRTSSYVEYEVVRDPYEWESELFFSLTEREREIGEMVFS